MIWTSFLYAGTPFKSLGQGGVSRSCDQGQGHTEGHIGVHDTYARLVCLRLK